MSVKKDAKGRVRVIIRVKEDVYKWYVEEAQKYSVAYTSLMAIVLGQNMDKQENERAVMGLSTMTNKTSIEDIKEMMKELSRVTGEMKELEEK